MMEKVQKTKVPNVSYGSLSTLINDLDLFPDGKIQIMNDSKVFLLTYDDICWNEISIRNIQKRIGQKQADAAEAWRIITLMDQELMDEEEEKTAKSE